MRLSPRQLYARRLKLKLRVCCKQSGGAAAPQTAKKLIDKRKILEKRDGKLAYAPEIRYNVGS